MRIDEYDPYEVVYIMTERWGRLSVVILGPSLQEGATLVRVRPGHAEDLDGSEFAVPSGLNAEPVFQ